MPAPRVGLVVHGQPPELVGGTERLVADLARELVARGHVVEVFSGSIEWRPAFEVVRLPGAVPVVRVHRHDLFFERWDKLENPLVERAFLDWLDAFRPELLHVHHWARLTTTLVRSARAAGVPVVLSLHDLFASCPRYHRVKADLSFCEVPPSPEACRHCAPRWRFQGDAEIDGSVRAFAEDLRAEVAAADALLAPTAGHAARLLGWLGLQRPVTALPPASETRLAPATRPLGERAATPEQPLRVGMAGHLHVLKGVEVLLDAQAGLPDPRLVELQVWGAAPTPEQEAALRARAGERRVVWHGAFTPADLSAAPIDVAVVPTLCAESYSFALDEACALGVPVQASDLGALHDRATSRVALFPRGDARALAALLQRLAAEPAERRRLAQGRPPPRLSAPEHLATLLATYADVLSRPRPVALDARARAARDEGLARRMHLFALREAGLQELLRSEGWEDVVGRLAAENEALKRR
jgi:glycosyltransferase involved in cell wall biosynthesis